MPWKHRLGGRPWFRTWCCHSANIKMSKSLKTVCPPPPPPRPPLLQRSHRARRKNMHQVSMALLPETNPPPLLRPTIDRKPLTLFTATWNVTSPTSPSFHQVEKLPLVARGKLQFNKNHPAWAFPSTSSLCCSFKGALPKMDPSWAVTLQNPDRSTIPCGLLGTFHLGFATHPALNPKGVLHSWKHWKPSSQGQGL